MKRLVTSLELKDEIDLHRKGWIIQRVGWAVLSVIFIAASLGVFGLGVLSGKVMQADDQRIVYERFVRFESPFKMEIEARSTNDKISITIPHGYLAQMKLEKMIPEPVTQVATPYGIEFIFPATGESRVILMLEPDGFGPVHSEILVNKAKFALSHFIYP